MSTKVTIAGGSLILAGGLALAVYANINVPALKDAKATTVNKYVTLSENALKSGNLKDAEKFAKKAIVADPSNKNALGSFKAASMASCPKVSATAVATPAPAQPATPDAEPEEEMGCI